jgi:transglutaminase-like putative cysteine protease
MAIVRAGGDVDTHVSTIDIALDYEVEAPAHFCFNIEAAHCAGQHILAERLVVSPEVAPRHFRDVATGNRFMRFDAAPGRLSLRYQARVQVLPQRPEPTLPEVPVSQVPDEVFSFLLPSRYCESDVMAGCAQQMFGKLPPGLSRVQAIVDWIQGAIRYLPCSTISTTSAQDVFVQRTGVCRDFAHLGITLCRALNIPARLVVGYVWFDEPPQDFHAVFEAWLGGQWVLFDPSGMAPVERLVRTGTGRDAKDVAFSTIFGAVRMTRKELRIDEREHQRQHDIEELVAAQALAEA